MPDDFFEMKVKILGAMEPRIAKQEGLVHILYLAKDAK